MKVILCDLQENLTTAWENWFLGENDVFVHQEDIFSVGRADAIIIASNSFGSMCDGLDLVYRNHFGENIEKQLKSYIHQLSMKELLVGQALVLYTYNENIPWMIAAPTMRVPSDVSDTVNAYLAFKAALLAAKEENFESIICPDLGTGTGRMSAEKCARQMYQAYKDFKQNTTTSLQSLLNESRKHQALGGSQSYV